MQRLPGPCVALRPPSPNARLGAQRAEQLPVVSRDYTIVKLSASFSSLHRENHRGRRHSRKGEE